MATHTFITMGTVASICFGGATPHPEVLAEIERAFTWIERRFSLFSSDSEISRIARHELALTDSSPTFRDTYARALDWRMRTNNAFTPHRPDGLIDLSGLVKAEAMEEGGRILDAARISNWLLNVGGDVLARGQVGDQQWRAGVIDPQERGHLLCACVLDSRFRALATSGTTERGEHIWRAEPGKSYLQVSVLATDIVTADVLATAVMAGGATTLAAVLAAFTDTIHVLTVDPDGNLTATPRFARSDGLAVRH